MSDEFDYFDMYKLSKQDTRQVNCKKLQEELYKANQRHGREAETRQAILKQAVAIFTDETKYQNYLKKLDDRNPSTGDTTEPKPEKPQPQAAPTMTGWRLAGSLVKAVLKPSPQIEEVVDGIADLMSNRQTQASQPSVNQQPIITQQSINLSGNWRDIDGTFGTALNYLITQRGGWLVLQGNQQVLWSSVLMLHAEGQISGRSIQMEYRHTSGGYGQLDLEITADGRSLEGRGMNFAKNMSFLVRFAHI